MGSNPTGFPKKTMIKHHTKTKGDLGVLKAKVAAFEKGYITLTPDSEHMPFDFVMYRDRKFLTTQVKYRSLKNGKLTVQFRSTASNSQGFYAVPVDKSLIDLYIIYCPDTDKCYYLNPDDFNASITLTVDTSTDNKQNRLIDFEDIPETLKI